MSIRLCGVCSWVGVLVVASVAALAVAAGDGGATASAQRADPIVGLWNYSDGGVVQVTGSGTSFTGTVVKATGSPGNCSHPVGEVIWRITKSGSAYTGTYQWFGPGAGCVIGSPADRHPAAWTIVERGGTLILHYCIKGFVNVNDEWCYDLTRAKPVAPPKPKPAAGKKTYRWFAHAFYSNPKTSTVSSYAEGPRGSERGLLTVASGRTSGGRSATFRITDTLKGGKKRVISMLTDGVARFSFGAGGGGTLVLRAHVTGSTYPGCKRGKRILLTLVDGAGAAPDSLEVKGCGAVRRYVERQAHMVVHVVIDEKPGAGPTTTSDPIVGLWKSEDIVYRWVAIKGGYEEQATTPLWDENNCQILAGEAITHYIWNRVKGSQVYEEIHRIWTVNPGGPGDDGMGCSKAWKRDKGMVKIVRTGNQMTVSCDNELGNPCHPYTRVGP